jgi:hypothetical protein
MKKGLWWSGSDVGRAPTTFFSFTIRPPFLQHVSMRT